MADEAAPFSESLLSQLPVKDIQDRCQEPPVFSVQLWLGSQPAEQSMCEKTRSTHELNIFAPELDQCLAR